MKKPHKPHRAVVEVDDKKQYDRFRALLLQKYGLTVSNWFRREMGKELGEVVNQTPYLNGKMRQIRH